MKLKLLSGNLHYLSIGTGGRIHVCMTRSSAADKGHRTICNMDTSSMILSEERIQNAEYLCKRCYAVLRTFSALQVEAMG